MLEGIEVLYHSSIKIKKETIIYFDPFKIDREYHDADIIFITHNHYDHYSEEDINMIRKENTKIVAPLDLLDNLLTFGFTKDNITLVKPNENHTVKGLTFKTVPAYNTNKSFHPKEKNWVGYLLDYNGITYYIAGDTDITEENRQVKCDIAFVPIGGTYTMNYKEASELINEIKPKIAVPTHYASIVGKKEDGIKFAKLLDSEIECKIYIN